MRVMILGGAGMLGHKVWQTLRGRFETWVTLRSSFDAYAGLGLFDPARTIAGLDAASEPDLRRAFAIARPGALVNCVGIVKQLPASRDPIASLTVNSLLPHRLAAICCETGCRLIHVSTDCVFSGRKGRYTEDDPPDAEDLYGRTKLLGEPHIGDAAALTLRTSIVGRELRSTTGLVEWLLSQRGGRVRGFTRAVFTGLTTNAFAQLLEEVIGRQPALSGLYHVSSPAITKYDLLVRLNEAFRAGVVIEPSDEVAVDRSLDSTRFWRATGFDPPRWDTMIAAMLADATPYEEWRQIHVS